MNIDSMPRQRIIRAHRDNSSQTGEGKDPKNTKQVEKANHFSPPDQPFF